MPSCLKNEDVVHAQLLIGIIKKIPKVHYFPFEILTIAAQSFGSSKLEDVKANYMLPYIAVIMRKLLELHIGQLRQLSPYQPCSFACHLTIIHTNPCSPKETTDACDTFR